ncbi:MAG: DEAD/DEAH box helicase [Nitrospirae bacterium]|nr:DEAD/DEAH box helicase [Nitrospirota bacterium]
MHSNFQSFALSEETLRALSGMGIETPTAIQQEAIGPALKGHDIVGLAQTGTGKTAAFGIPLVESPHAGKSRRPYAIVLVPTRELAMQVSLELGRIGEHRGITTIPIYGGQSMVLQLKSLSRGADIVVGTPGRVIDHITRKSLSLAEIRHVVLDEADEMLNMGFVDDIKTILDGVPAERQMMLFSATMPREIMRISENYMRDPMKIRVAAQNTVVDAIKQVFHEVREDDKISVLSRIIDTELPSLMLVFCHTKRETDEVAESLGRLGYKAGAIHGDFTQAARDEAMGKFRKGQIDILVATDVAARGIDVSDVSHVVNYSLPQNPEAYVHRIGRTGRAGKSGIAISLVSSRQFGRLRMIERTAKTVISRAMSPSWADVKLAREKTLVGKLVTAITEKKHNGLETMAKSLIAEHSASDVVAAALHLLAGDAIVEAAKRAAEERNRPAYNSRPADNRYQPRSDSGSYRPRRDNYAGAERNNNWRGSDSGKPRQYQGASTGRAR